MEKLSYDVYITFGFALIATLYIFSLAIPKPKGFIILISIWVLLQSIIGISGFYTVTDTIPPRLQLLLFPTLILIVLQFSTKKGKIFIDSLNIKTLTIIHIVRIPVEIVLYWLFIGKAVPQLMTFEGRNFDIISGLTSPIVYYFGFVKKSLNKYILLFWNLLCLVFLLNILVNGIFSAPTPFQLFGFEQPNIAILHFPFLLLPACIVPIVLFSHLASIRYLMINNK